MMQLLGECSFCKDSSNNKHTRINYLNRNICTECYKHEKKDIFDYQSKIPPLYPQIDQIYESIYIGNLDGAKLKENLKEVNITHLLNCSKHLVCLFPNNFVYLELDIDDKKNDENITKFFETSFRFIKNANVTLIHCLDGNNVSASILIAFIMWSNKKTFDEAFKIVFEKRPSICLSESYIKQIKDYNYNDLII